MLGCSAIELANRRGVGSASIERYEVPPSIPIARAINIMVIRNTFEEAGIEFTGDPLVNPGVALCIKRDNYILSVLSFSLCFIKSTSVFMRMSLCMLKINPCLFYPSYLAQGRSGERVGRYIVALLTPTS